MGGRRSRQAVFFTQCPIRHALRSCAAAHPHALPCVALPPSKTRRKTRGHFGTSWDIRRRRPRHRPRRNGCDRASPCVLVHMLGGARVTPPRPSHLQLPKSRASERVTDRRGRCAQVRRLRALWKVEVVRKSPKNASKNSAMFPDCRNSFCAPGVELAQKELRRRTACPTPRRGFRARLALDRRTAASRHPELRRAREILRSTSG